MSSKRVIQLSLILVLLVATFATASSARAWTTCASTYVVQRGDWLSKIARNCGVSLSSLYAANPWVGPVIYPGQVLNIPGGYSSSGFCGPLHDAAGSFYIVCSGDTLGGIAMYYGTTWRRLQAINGIPNASRIYPGQTIRVY